MNPTNPITESKYRCGDKFPTCAASKDFLNIVSAVIVVATVIFMLNTILQFTLKYPHLSLKRLSCQELYTYFAPASIGLTALLIVKMWPLKRPESPKVN